MSSHHFVREGQEPALFIADPVPFRLAAGLLEWAPQVMVADTAMEDVLSWGIKIDVFFIKKGRENEIATCLADHIPFRIVSFSEDSGVITSCLSFMSSQNSGLNILTKDAEKILFELNETGFNGIVVMDEVRRWTRSAIEFQKWVPINSEFRIWKTTPGQVVESEQVLPTGREYVSTKEGMIKFISSAPFWVGERF